MNYSIKAFLIAGCVGCGIVAAFTACSADDDGGGDFKSPQTVTATPPVLSLNGASGYYTLPNVSSVLRPRRSPDASDNDTLANASDGSWQIVECPLWITPVKTSGLSAADTIKLYVESNSRTPLRTGDIVVQYADGRTVTTRAEQTNEQPKVDMRRNHASGWGFDVRTYNDSRGLRDQIFNLQKLLDQDPEFYRIERNTASDLKLFFGDDASSLQSDINGEAKVEGKFGLFKLDLQASFGMTSLQDTKRIFSWVRAYYNEYVVYMNSVDMEDAQTNNYFTLDFAEMRKKVIDSGGSDETIAQLIDRYGTHFITVAQLGGCFDYYFSSVYDMSKKGVDVKGAINLSYASKFNLKGDGKFSEDLKTISQEKIEKFSVKGGNAIDLTNDVYSGKINEDSIRKWKDSLVDMEKVELLGFDSHNISMLFPDDIADKIEAYMDRLYYAEVPVTRARRVRSEE